MFTWLALSAVACAPRGTSHRAQSPNAPAVVDVPEPTPGTAAPRSPASFADAGAPDADAEAVFATPTTGDAGASLSFHGSLQFGTRDGGVTFDGSFASRIGSSLPALSPALIVRSALLLPASASESTPALLLFDHPADCSADKDQGIRVSIDWKRGTKTTFVNMSVINGQSARYKGRIEVINAPTAPGSTGTIQLDPIPDGNLRGSYVPVHVCP